MFLLYSSHPTHAACPSVPVLTCPPPPPVLDVIEDLTRARHDNEALITLKQAAIQQCQQEQDAARAKRDSLVVELANAADFRATELEAVHAATLHVDSILAKIESLAEELTRLEDRGQGLNARIEVVQAAVEGAAVGGVGAAGKIAPIPGKGTLAQS